MTERALLGPSETLSETNTNDVGFFQSQNVLGHSPGSRQGEVQGRVRFKGGVHE
jgi:hypothetical protein